ncbi:sulfotransferase domain-containing protein [Candidatus Omnitrophota bacterium]
MPITDFIIIGSIKCGTTSLYLYLNEHPAICMSRRKETNYFIEEFNFSKGDKWYAHQFKEKDKLCGEGSPLYSAFPIYRGVPEKIKKYSPQCKIIYVVRDPIERYVSHYFLAWKGYVEKREFSDVTQDFTDSNEYLIMGKYYFQLEQYLKFFDMSQILVVKSDDLKYRRKESLSRIFSFLGVKEDFYSEKFDFELNREEDNLRQKKPRKIVRMIQNSIAWNIIPNRIQEGFKKRFYPQGKSDICKPVLTTQDKTALREYYSDDIMKLQNLTKDDFSGWLS